MKDRTHTIELPPARRPKQMSEAERAFVANEHREILASLDNIFPPAQSASTGPPHAAVAPLACDPSAGIPLMPPPACHARFFANGALYPVRLNHYPQVATCSMTLNQPR